MPINTKQDQITYLREILDSIENGWGNTPMTDVEILATNMQLTNMIRASREPVYGKAIAELKQNDEYEDAAERGDFMSPAERDAATPDY
jgi:hypothetical protein